MKSEILAHSLRVVTGSSRATSSTAIPTSALSATLSAISEEALLLHRSARGILHGSIYHAKHNPRASLVFYNGNLNSSTGSSLLLQVVKTRSSSSSFLVQVQSSYRLENSSFLQIRNFSSQETDTEKLSRLARLKADVLLDQMEIDSTTGMLKPQKDLTIKTSQDAKNLSRNVIRSFQFQKQTVLRKDDKSGKKSWDAPIIPLLEVINEHSDYYTLSSCSGRAFLWWAQPQSCSILQTNSSPVDTEYPPNQIDDELHFYEGGKELCSSRGNLTPIGGYKIKPLGEGTTSSNHSEKNEEKPIVRVPIQNGGSNNSNNALLVRKKSIKETTETPKDRMLKRKKSVQIVETWDSYEGKMSNVLAKRSRVPEDAGDGISRNLKRELIRADSFGTKQDEKDNEDDALDRVLNEMDRNDALIQAQDESDSIENLKSENLERTYTLNRTKHDDDIKKMMDLERDVIARDIISSTPSTTSSTTGNKKIEKASKILSGSASEGGLVSGKDGGGVLEEGIEEVSMVPSSSILPNKNTRSNTWRFHICHDLRNWNPRLVLDKIKELKIDPEKDHHLDFPDDLEFTENLYRFLNNIDPPTDGNSSISSSSFTSTGAGTAAGSTGGSAGGAIWLRYEPFVLHVACIDLPAAKRLIDIARPFFPKSSLLSWKKNRHVVQILGEEYIESPYLVSSEGAIPPKYWSDYVDSVVSEKFGRNEVRTRGLFDALEDTLGEEVEIDT